MTRPINDLKRKEVIVMEIKLLTTKEVAEKLHCSTHHVGYLRMYGLIRGTRYARNWLYLEEDIDAFIAATIGKDFWNFRDMTPDTAQKEYGITAR